MKGPRRDTQPKAVSAARRSAKAPAPKSEPNRPTKPKPAPPVFDCLKCQKLAAEKREVTRLRREVERLIGLDRARVQAALAGQPVTISDAEIAEHIQAAYAPAFAQVLQVPVEIALSCSEEAGDRLKAAAMITERVAGKVADKHILSGGLNLSAIGTLDVFVHPSEAAG